MNLRALGGESFFLKRFVRGCSRRICRRDIGRRRIRARHRGRGRCRTRRRIVSCWRILLIGLLIRRSSLALRIPCIGRLRGVRCRSRARVRANRLPADHQLHSPIFLPSLCRRVGCDRIVLPESLRYHVVELHTLAGQVIANRSRALFRQLLVVLIASNAVGVTVHFKMQVG